MLLFLWYLYLFTAICRLVWWSILHVGIHKKSTRPLPDAPSYEGISVVVCAHNNCVGLQQLIPLLLKQKYPLFEIIVVNDRSQDGTEAWLKKVCIAHNTLKTITIGATPPEWNSKKYALQQGIKQAQYPLIALTDSDCTPLSDRWLEQLALAFQHPDVNIFLGFSPYHHEKTVLNGLIRTETLFTAIQYLGMAKLNMTYMGVGRNLGYRKSFVEDHLDQFPFQNHIGGDDDLLINHLSSGKDAAVALHPESFMVSEPVKSWKAWWQQKRRHLSAGQKYKFSTQCLLASYWFSALGFWALFFGLCVFSPLNWTILIVHAVILILGMLILNSTFRIFKEGSLLILFPFWDFLYIACSSIIGLSTFGVKNKRWS